MAVKLEHVLKRVQALPLLPTSAMRVIALTKNPEASVKDLQTVISQDPALAANILKRANSAYYGYARRIASLQEAIVILGFNAIQGLAMAAAVSPLLRSQLIGYQIEQEELWQHSLLTAMAAKNISKYLKLPFYETAFTAGLIHDIGKLILTIYVEVVGDILLKQMNESQLSYAELEAKIIGYDHATVGGFIAKHWSLPDELVEAINYHHKPLEAKEHSKLASIVHVANGLANILGKGGVDCFLNPVDPDALSHLNLTENDIDHLLSQLGEIISDPAVFN